MRKSKLTFLLTLFFLLNCESKEELPESLPFLKMDEVTRINKIGVQLRTELRYKLINEVDEAGFVISQIERPTIDDRKIIISDFKNGILSTFIDNDLSSNGSTYFVRSYAMIEDLLIYSNMVSFKSQGSLPPQIDHFYPDQASPGTKITIVGNYFSELPLNNAVTFEAKSAPIIKATKDTLIVICPNTEYGGPSPISIAVSSYKATSKTNFTVANPWSEGRPFPGTNRLECFSFTLASKGYLMMGLQKDTIYSYSSTDVWEYDLIQDSWSIVGLFPGNARRNGISFSIAEKGYLGLGIFQYKDPSDSQIYIKIQKDFWRFDPLTNAWLELQPCPLSQRRNDYFIADEKLYLFSEESTSYVWMYDPKTNEWSELELENQDFSLAGTFSFEENGYILESKDRKDYKIWKFNTSNNQFQKVDSVRFGKNNSYLFDFEFILNSVLYFSETNSFNRRLHTYDLTEKTIYYQEVPDFSSSSIGYKFISGNTAVLNKNETNLISSFRVK